MISESDVKIENGTRFDISDPNEQVSKEDRSVPSEPEQEEANSGNKEEARGDIPESEGNAPSTDVKMVVSLKGVSKHYGGEENLIRALDNVNLQIRKGAVVSIMGPSGSGKSTLINMIGSLDTPSHGEVIIDGTNLEKMSQKELTSYRSDKVGFIFQSFNLLPNLTALENVELPMEFNDQFRNERRQRAENLLKSIGMTKRSDHFPASLSGGEKQRIAIARALANNPSIILADEPTGNLDSRTGVQIIELLKKLAKNRSKTLIIVTHDQNIANMTDEIITISDGKITRIRDVGDEQASQAITTTLNIRQSYTNLLYDAGYKSVEEILAITDAQLAKLKGLRAKDRSHILNRITKARKNLLGKYHDPGIVSQSPASPTPSPPSPSSTPGKNTVCPHCKKDIPMEGVKFCPFCAGRMGAGTK